MDEREKDTIFPPIESSYSTSYSAAAAAAAPLPASSCGRAATDTLHPAAVEHQLRLLHELQGKHMI